MSTIMKISDVDASYIINEKTQVYAVSRVSLELKQGEIMGIAGESGCGKSTLMKVIYGFIEPPLKVSRGEVKLYIHNNGFNILSMDRDSLRSKIWWKHISWIPQGAQNVLNPTLRIRDHFIETIRTFTKKNKEEAYEMAKEHILGLGLPEDVLTAFPHQLSGGMRQRVIIALSIILRPEVILADEPTSALDVVNQKIILQMFRTIRDEHKSTVVLVSHDMDVHGVVTDRVAIMYAGNIVEIGNTDDIFDEPLHPYTKALIESLPRLGERSIKKGLGGQPPDLTRPPPGCRFHPRCPYAKDICTKEEPPEIDLGEGRKVKCWLYSCK